MKKILIAIILVFALSMCLVACNDVDNEPNDPTQNSTPTPEEEVLLGTLNDLAAQSYSKIKLDITTVTGGLELKSSYTMTDSAVEYSVEQFNLLPEDGNLENISPDYKTTLTGTAVIENGVVSKMDGDPVSLPEFDELAGKFNFDKGNLKNIQIEDGKLSADVFSASEFLGTDKTINSVKVTVEFNDSAIETITITYNTINSSVTTVYGFEK